MVQAIANHLEDLLQAGIASPAQIGAISETELTALYAFSLKELDAGQHENAFKLLQGLTALDDSKAKYWRALGVAAQCAGLNDEALKAYEKALSLDNKSAYIYIYRAEIYLQLGHIGAAGEDLYTAYLLHKKHQLAPPLLERLDKTNRRLKSKDLALSAARKPMPAPEPAQKVPPATSQTTPQVAAAKAPKAPLKTGISPLFDADLEKTLTAIKAPKRAQDAPPPQEGEEEVTHTAIKAAFDPEVTKTSIKPLKGAP